MLTALALAGAAMLAVLAAIVLLCGRTRPSHRPRRPRREVLSRRFNFDRYKRYENK
jgi:hypothetical protein